MSDYHSIALNLVVSCNIHEVKAQKVCECQDTNSNKNALVFLSSNYINWTLTAALAEHICENCISTLFHSNRLCLLFCILTSSVWNFRASFFNDVDFDIWNSLSDAYSGASEQAFSTSDHVSMRRLQKWTNRDSIIYWLQIWRRTEL